MKLSELIKELQELEQYGDHEVTIYGHNNEELQIDEMGTQVNNNNSIYGFFLDIKNKE